MISWLKKLIRIVGGYDEALRNAHQRISSLEKLVRDQTTISADIGPNISGNYVIVVGRYKNNDYVETFLFNSDSLAEIIEQLKHMRKYGRVDRVDCPPTMRHIIPRWER